MTRTTMLSAAAVVSLGLCAYAEQIADTSGYVALKQSDGMGSSSFNSGLNWADGQAPVAGRAYIVQHGYQLRTPNASTGRSVFAGDSVTLDNGVINLKGGDNAEVEANWIVTEGSFENGNNGARQTVLGRIDVRTTVARPLSFMGLADGERLIRMKARLVGDENALIRVTRAATDIQDVTGKEFRC